MKNKICIIDTFTTHEFSGNPAAVYHIHENKTKNWMQKFAAEMNLSETAFIKKRKNNSWSLKWFTPSSEVDLCGHATLASAHYLWNQKIIKKRKAQILDQNLIRDLRLVVALVLAILAAAVAHRVVDMDCHPMMKNMKNAIRKSKLLTENGEDLNSNQVNREMQKQGMKLNRFLLYQNQ